MVESEDFSGDVKRIRQLHGLSQEDLARELGVSFATVNRWENGKTKPSKMAKRAWADFVSKQKLEIR